MSDIALFSTINLESLTFIVNSILDLIGDAPMLRIHRSNPNKNLEMCVKLEKFNPGGSVKDRICKYMIEYAEKEKGDIRNSILNGVYKQVNRRVISNHKINTEKRMFN